MMAQPRRRRSIDDRRCWWQRLRGYGIISARRHQ